MPIVGQLVLVYGNTRPRTYWKMARILELSSIRTAVIKTIPGGNITSRATQHLYPLEIEPCCCEELKSQTFESQTKEANGHIVRPEDKTTEETSEQEEKVHRYPRRERRKKRDKDFIYEFNSSDEGERTCSNIRQSLSFSLCLIGILAILSSLFQVTYSKPSLNNSEVELANENS